MTLAAWVLAIGTLLFSADLTLRAVQGARLFPMAATAGGFLMIAGWVLVVLAAFAPRGWVPRAEDGSRDPLPDRLESLPIAATLCSSLLSGKQPERVFATGLASFLRFPPTPLSTNRPILAH